MKKLYFCDVTDEEFMAVSNYIAHKVMDLDKQKPLYPKSNIKKPPVPKHKKQ